MIIYFDPLYSPCYLPFNLVGIADEGSQIGPAIPTWKINTPLAARRDVAALVIVYLVRPSVERSHSPSCQTARWPMPRELDDEIYQADNRNVLARVQK
jgi:hypothetical protein